MGGEIPVGAAAEGIEVSILEPPFTLCKHPQGLALVRLDRGRRLLQHGLGLGRGTIFGGDYGPGTGHDHDGQNAGKQEAKHLHMHDPALPLSLR
jgi:hypothetical protein